MKTVEEAARAFTKAGEINPDDCFQSVIQEAFTFGANWQKEQSAKLGEHSNSFNAGFEYAKSKMYTEEEVKELINNYHASFATYPTMNLDLRDNWFETNKKK
jgi:hypothetical protein